jgi:divalent metal cation (Fe/Co/Zn/Cd) transporter
VSATEAGEAKNTWMAGVHRAHVRTGLRLSVASMSWTAAAGSAAVVIGVVSGSVVVVAFGSIGMIDGVGSAALVVHFRHALRHQAMSVRLERTAWRVVTVGMAAAGLAIATVSAVRLVAHQGGHAVLAAVIGSGCSAVVLGVLAAAKRRAARRIPSHALLADSWLSWAGAALAVVTVVSTALIEVLRWPWLDPAAAIAIAAGAVAMSVALRRDRPGPEAEV